MAALHISTSLFRRSGSCFCRSSTTIKPLQQLKQSFQIRYTLSHQRYQTTSVIAPSIKHTSIPLSKDPIPISIPRSKSFPRTSHKSVAYWLLGSAASVFGIVVFGGLTRLTESGLSITEWRPVTGSLPPFNDQDWKSEFTKYRSSPEYMRLNPNMTLEEFKKIYWMEWTHRLWGRVIGVTFLVPTIYFIARKKVAPHMAWKLAGITALIGLQGAIGWWMVKSGLKDDLFASGSVPRVSQYRLAAHLGTAFIAYSAMLLSGLSIIREHRFLKDPQTALNILEKLSTPQMRRFRIAAFIVTGMVFTTAMSGALVAGLDAGLIYNEFPWMGLGLTPPKSELFDPRYSRKADQSDLVWRNACENPSLVQLDHRILATSTFLAILTLYLWPRARPALKSVMPRDISGGLTGTMHMASIQVALGISTLIFLVPTWLAATHQAGALALLSLSLILSSRLRISPRTVKLIRQAAAQNPSSPAQSNKHAGNLQQIMK